MLYAAPVITVYCVVLAVILGACMGSFLNCWAWRIVHGESVTKGRSHCDACGHALAFRDLVPVVSYLASHGKCRYCGKKLGVRHLVAELSTAAVYAAILLKYDISLQTLEYILCQPALRLRIRGFGGVYDSGPVYPCGDNSASGLPAIRAGTELCMD